MDGAANMAAKAMGVVKLGKARMRIIAAFAVAPLCAAAIVTSPFLAMASPWTDIGAISVTFAYLSMLVLGVPAFYFLKARKLIYFWIAPATGFVIGAATYLIFEIVIGLAFGLDLADALSGMARDLTSPGRGDLVLLALAGVSGAAAALVFWMIARPGSDNVDREES